MSLSGRLMKGVYVASDSFLMLWNNPILFVYMIGAALIYLLAQVPFFNVPTDSFWGDNLNLFFGIQGLRCCLAELTHWVINGLVVVVTFLYSFVVTFLHVCLVRHTLAIMYADHERASMSVVLKNAWSLRGLVTKWAVLLTGISLALRVMALSTLAYVSVFSCGLVLSITAVAVWSLVTFFVVPLIAVQKNGLLGVMYSSWNEVTKKFVEIIGAQLWMGVVVLLTFIPLIILLRVLSQGVGLGVLILYFLTNIAIVVAGYSILSCQTVLKTKLYYMHPEL